MIHSRAIFDLNQFVNENLWTIDEMEHGRITYEENGVNKTREQVTRLRFQNSQHEARLKRLQQDED